MEDWQSEDYRPSKSRKQLDESIGERERREAERTEEIVAAAVAAGTARPQEPMRTRYVDPATLRQEAKPKPGVPKARELLPGAIVAAPREEPEVGRAFAEKTCAREACEVVFTPTGPRQRFCSGRCREWPVHKGFGVKNCAWAPCGKEFTLTQPRHRYCSAACRDESDRKHKRESKQRSRDAERVQRAGDEAVGASSERQSEDSGAPVELRRRYLELLFDLGASPDTDASVKIDVLGRLERIVTAPAPR